MRMDYTASVGQIFIIASQNYLKYLYSSTIYQKNPSSLAFATFCGIIVNASIKCNASRECALGNTHTQLSLLSQHMSWLQHITTFSLCGVPISYAPCNKKNPLLTASTEKFNISLRVCTFQITRYTNGSDLGLLSKNHFAERQCFVELKCWKSVLK